MPGHRRSNSYRLRIHDIDPLLTYDGIKTNSLPYIDNDLLSIDKNSLCLAELYYEHWDINLSIEQISLHDPYLFSNIDENIYLKTQYHPLKWLYELIQNKQLFISYSSKQCTLTLVYSFQSTKSINLFSFYRYFKENDKVNCFIKHLFTFDDYVSISQIDNNINAINTIDFIYQELQASTMIDQNHQNYSISFESLLNNDVIRLKDHQIKSSKQKIFVFVLIIVF
jgi:hypothetical protein